MSVIGLDIGTTGCKAIALGGQGEVLANSASEYPISIPQAGWAEQDAEQVWAIARTDLAKVIAAVRHYDTPRAIALSVQGEAVTPVDSSGRCLYPTILGMDTRTVQENQWLAERFGAESLYHRTGMPLHTINTLPKLLWLQRHEPTVWRSARWFLLYEDLLMQRLSGYPTLSHCLASRTQMYDLGESRWMEDVLESCRIEIDRLSPLASSQGGAIGTLRRELMQEWGLEAPVLLVGGGHDQACAALGSGVIRPGLAMVSTGTAEVMEVAMAKPALTEPLRQGNISVYRHVVPDLYLAMTLNHSGGLVLRWYRDTFCIPEQEEARATGNDAYDLILAGAPAGPTGLLVLPHLAGSGTPLFDTSSKGAVLGLTLDTSRATLAKALLEGLTFELRLNLDLLRAGGVRIDSLCAVGGGARSALWLQLKADICQLPLRVPRVREAACLGAALLAGVAAGVYRGLAEAVAESVRQEAMIEPQGPMIVAYEQRYELYRQLYPTVAALNHQLQGEYS